MASKSSSAPADGPRLGAFLTLTVALLLVFGGISRVGQLREIGTRLSAPQEDRIASARRKLREERERAILVIGSGSLGGGFERTRAPDSPVPVSAPTERDEAPAERAPAPPPPAPGGTPPPAPAPAPHERVPTDEQYTVRARDTLYEIAERFYGDGTLWPLIRQANPGIDPNRLRIGTPLRIPLRDGRGRRLVDPAQARASGAPPRP